MKSEKRARPVFGEPLQPGEVLELSDDEKEFRDLVARVNKSVKEKPKAQTYKLVRIKLPLPDLAGPFRPLHMFPAPGPDDISDEAENWRWARDQRIAFGSQSDRWNESPAHLYLVARIRTLWKWESPERKQWVRRAFASMLDDEQGERAVSFPEPGIAPPEQGKNFVIIPAPPGMDSHADLPTAGMRFD